MHHAIHHPHLLLVNHVVLLTSDLPLDATFPFRTMVSNSNSMRISSLLVSTNRSRCVDQVKEHLMVNEEFELISQKVVNGTSSHYTSWLRLSFCSCINHLCIMELLVGKYIGYWGWYQACALQVGWVQLLVSVLRHMCAHEIWLTNLEEEVKGLLLSAFWALRRPIHIPLSS